jgi:hypothetical protein
MARHLHVTVSQGFGGPGRSLKLLLHTSTLQQHHALLSVLVCGSWQLAINIR